MRDEPLTQTPNAEPRSSWLRQDPWTLQVCLDTFSWALDVPFQAFDWRAAEGFYLTFRDRNARFAAMFPHAHAFATFLDELPEDPTQCIARIAKDEDVWADVARSAQPALWITTASYASPLVRLFRDHWQYQTWECLFFLKTLGCEGRTIPDPAGPALLPGPGFMNGLTQYAVLDVPALQLVLVSFPIMTFNRPDAPLGQFDTVGASLVEGFLRCLAEDGIKPLTSLATLKRFENVRAGATIGDLKNRLLIAREALDRLSRLEMPESFEIGRGNCQRIATAALFASMIKPFNFMPDLESDPKWFGRTLLFRLMTNRPNMRPRIPDWSLRVPLDPDSATPMSVAMDVDWSWVSRSEADLTGQLAIEDDGTPSSAGEAGGGSLGRYAAQDVAQDVAPDAAPGAAEDGARLHRADSSYSWLLDSMQTRRNAHDFEVLLLLRTWLIDRFGGLSLLARHLANDDRNRSIAELGCEIARRLTGTTGAEVCTLHYYNRRHDMAIPLGLYHVAPEQEARWREALPAQMKLASEDGRVRNQSIVYRALDDAVAKVCFSFDPDSGVSDPSDVRMLKAPEGIWQPRCANVSPINVYGRPWGAINLMGTRPYQFASNTGTSIQDFADLFGTHIYHQWLLLHLDQMNGVATDDTLSVEERCRQICVYLSDVLLSESATLWVRDLANLDRFYAAAWTNRPDLDALAERSGATTEPRDDGAPEFFFRDETSLSGRLLEGGLAQDEPYPWFQGVVGRGPLGGKWLEKPHTRGLRQLGYRYGCFVVVRLHDRAVGTFSLFNRRGRGYDDRWLGVFRLVAEEVALMLQAIFARQALEKRMLGPLRHEIRPRLAALAETQSRLAQITRHEDIKRLDLFRSLNIQMSDLRLGLQNLGRGVGRIIGSGANPRAWEDEDVIIQQAQDRERVPATGAVDIRSLFNELSHGFMREYRRKFVRYRYIGPDRSPPIFIDRDNLIIIFSNLLENAAKHAFPHDEIVVTIGEGHSGLKIRIINSGQVMIREEQERIFDRGFRGSGAESRGVPGSGLGLYYARQVGRLYWIKIDYKELARIDDNRAQHEFILSIPRRLLRR